MARRVLGGLLLGLLVWAGSGLAEGVVLPPAEVEIAELEDAMGQVTSFFARFILEIRGSLTMLSGRVADLERSTLVLRRGVDDLAARFTKLEGAVVPAIMALEARVTAIEKYDFSSLERRIAALDRANEALLIQIVNNRAKIEGLEIVLASLTASVEGLPAVVDGMRVEMDGLRQDVRAELEAFEAKTAAERQAMWTAIFLVPLAVGGLLFLLLSQG